MAPQSSTLAWKIPWTEEPGGLPSMGLHRVGHDWSNLVAAAAAAAVGISYVITSFVPSLYPYQNNQLWHSHDIASSPSPHFHLWGN